MVVVFMLKFSSEKDRTTYSDLLAFLKDLRDWQTLGTHILPGNTAESINRISAAHNGNVRECKKALFNEYLRFGDRSWRTVIAGLIKTGCDNLAKDIKQQLGLYVYMYICTSFYYCFVCSFSALQYLCFYINIALTH